MISLLFQTIRQINAGIIVGATQCLLDLISDNSELLDKNVDLHTLGEFIKLIDDKGPKHQYMAFFSAISSCQGVPVASNQEDVLRMLYLDKSKRSHYFLSKVDVDKK